VVSKPCGASLLGLALATGAERGSDLLDGLEGGTGPLFVREGGPGHGVFDVRVL
jgi:hypothetical protein